MADLETWKDRAKRIQKSGGFKQKETLPEEEKESFLSKSKDWIMEKLKGNPPETKPADKPFKSMSKEERLKRISDSFKRGS